MLGHFYSAPNNPAYLYASASEYYSNGGTDGFVASFNEDCTHRWSTPFGGTEDEADHGETMAIALDTDGRVHIAAPSKSASVSLGNLTVNRPAGAVTMTVYAILDGETGEPVHAEAFGDLRVRKILIDSDAMIWLAGFYDGHLQMGDVSKSNVGGRDGFIAGVSLLR